MDPIGNLVTIEYDTMDQILLLLNRAVAYPTFESIKYDLFPDAAAGQDDLFIRSIRKLKAHKLIKRVDEVSTNYKLTATGTLLFVEMAENKNHSGKPYTYFAQKEKQRKDDLQNLLKYQVLIASQQSDLNPLMKIANKSTVFTNKVLILVFSVTALLSGLTAYYTCLSYQLEARKVSENNQAMLLQQMIKQENLMIKSKCDSIHNQKVTIDSLEMICDSLQTK